jgi:hypothetical protein
MSGPLNSKKIASGEALGVKTNKAKAVLPIGRTASVAFQIDAMRSECCKAAGILADQEHLDEAELDECARLDDALAEAQKILKSTVAQIMISRLRRRSRLSER